MTLGLKSTLAELTVVINFCLFVCFFLRILEQILLPMKTDLLVSCFQCGSFLFAGVCVCLAGAVFSGGGPPCGRHVHCVWPLPARHHAAGAGLAG